jgi:tetratricopeptide (TPR) repeat protein
MSSLCASLLLLAKQAAEKVQRRPPQKAAATIAGALLAALLVGSAGMFGLAQCGFLSQQSAISIEGSVRNSAGEVVAGATVTLSQSERSFSAETKTQVDGRFYFSGIGAGSYRVRAESAQWGEALAEPVLVSVGEKKRIDLILGKKKPSEGNTSNAKSGDHPSAAAMDFEDKPNFTIAGVTDWSNVGLHGSGTDVRTSETLARDTLNLKSGAPEESASNRGARESEEHLRAAVARAPKSFEANHQLGEFYCHANKYAEAIPLLVVAEQLDSGNVGNEYELALSYVETGDLGRARELKQKLISNGKSSESHRMAGDIDERLGDPLGAVREYEQATRIDGSEENYFEWGSELLLHRAAQPAVEVFSKGTSAHPDSARMLTGLGAALYAAGSYDDAAMRLCSAADLKAEDPAPYVFLGKIEKASAEAFPCSEEKLARFAKDKPRNAVANYYYGLILWKRAKGSQNAEGLRRAQELLEKAVMLDPKLAEGYLQLGIVLAERGEFAQAAGAYRKAIEVNPQLGEAHYRLVQAYKRTGEEAEAQQEFQTYKQIEKADAEAIEKQRREQQQFLVILKDKPVDSRPR